MMIQLQTVFSLVRDNPFFYNSISYLIGGALTLVWGLAVLRSSPSKSTLLLALAGAAPLTLLNSYHHLYDVKILLLMVPGCLVLWTGRGFLGMASIFTGAIAIICTGDAAFAFYLSWVRNRFNLTSSSPNISRLAFEHVPIALVLTIAAVFFVAALAAKSAGFNLGQPCQVNARSSNPI